MVLPGWTPKAHNYLASFYNFGYCGWQTDHGNICLTSSNYHQVPELTDWPHKTLVRHHFSVIRCYWQTDHTKHLFGITLVSSRVVYRLHNNTKHMFDFALVLSGVVDRLTTGSTCLASGRWWRTSGWWTTTTSSTRTWSTTTSTPPPHRGSSGSSIKDHRYDCCQCQYCFSI